MQPNCHLFFAIIIIARVGDFDLLQLQLPLAKDAVDIQFAYEQIITPVA